jgi:hypothetical protein
MCFEPIHKSKWETYVHLMGGQNFFVNETINSIRKKIGGADFTRFTTYQHNHERK